MALILNRAKANTATTGTGTVTLGSAVVPFRSWAAAGAVDQKWYPYLIEDGNDWEIGVGLFDSTAGTLTRNLDASSTGALLNLTGSATVACVARDQDLNKPIAKLYKGSTQSVSSSALQTVTFTGLDGADLLGFWNGANPDRLTIPANKGIHSVRLRAMAKATATITAGSSWSCSILMNGSTTGMPNYYTNGAHNSGGYTSPGTGLASPAIPVVPGDYFGLGMQSSDTSWAIDVLTWLEIEVVD